MALQVTQRLSITTGAKPNLTAATTSDTYDVGPGMFAVIAIGATATVVTVVDPRTTENGQAFPAIVHGSATSVEKWIPLPGYLAGSNGKATINLSQAATVTNAAVSAF